jgi:HK97 family phage prohead protease
MKTLTRRQTANRQAKVQIRGKEGEEQFITGYAAVFYRESDPQTEYWLWSNNVERLMPGCFDRALSEGHDARGLFNHDSANLLGRVSNGTCELTVDNVGLRFEIPIDLEDPDHCRVVSKIRRGDLSGCSFAFANTRAEWEEVSEEGKDTIWVRKITDLDLYDVGPVTYPAYEATEVGLRTAVASDRELVEARSALTAHQDALAKHRQNESDAIDMAFHQVTESQNVDTF